MSRKILFLDLDGTLWDERPVREAIEGTMTNEQLNVLPEIAARVRRNLGYYTWTEVYRELGLDYPLLLAQHAGAIEPYPGVRKVLRALADDWSIWIATDGGLDYSRFKIDRLGIGPSISRVLTSDFMRTMKDDPTWWRRALDHAGCPARDAAAVGDSLWDVTVPATLGMRAIWIQNTPQADHLTTPPGIVCCRSFLEVPPLLGSKQSGHSSP
ncbi:MAG TPA: HAD family hydrolase [Thermoanaerobaculia bacterium]|nr:HAD family hydrolase [Thermoanaerobaculia bacterium]